jgi:type I restriction enzyme S subunit
MRPSGTEWLDKVPEHWKLRRLKEVGVLKGGAGFPPDMQDVVDEELPFYKVGDLKASMDGRLMAAPEHTISREIALKLRAAIIPIGSILYAKIGAALSLNRRRVTFSNCCIDNNMTAYTPQKKFIRTDWAFYWLSILDFDIYKNPGAVPSLSEGDQGALPILVPPLEEQTQIADFLADETAKIDELVAEAQSAIDLLQERRSALISAAVTGHIDVRQQPGI